MQTFNAVASLHSEGYLQISDFFFQTKPPYNLRHIREFNEIYRRVYPTLGRREKQQAEAFVDHMIAHVGQPQWAAKIYGVC